VLLLTNGEAVAVHALSDNRPGAISTLNNHLRHTRHRPEPTDSSQLDYPQDTVG